MRVFLFIILLFNLVFSSSCYEKKSRLTEIKIKPLHPYVSSPYDYNKEEKKQESYVVKFYFIDSAKKATDQLANIVDSFILNTITGDKDFAVFGGYHLLFYRKTKVINENFHEEIDGMITHNLIDEYKEDLLFEYTWSDKNFMGCKYYDKGKIIKIVYSKGASVLKRNPHMPSTDTSSVNIKEIQ